MELAETSSKRAFETPEPRGLHNLFSPDAPRGSLDKKVVTHFVSDYGDNVPESAHEDNYTGRSIIAVVVKTFVPCYIVQMPEKVRARIYSVSSLDVGMCSFLTSSSSSSSLTARPTHQGRSSLI